MPDDECDEVAADAFEGGEVGGFDDGPESFRMSHVFEDPGKAPPGSKTREKTFLDDVLQVFNHVVHSQKTWLNEPCFEKPVANPGNHHVSCVGVLLRFKCSLEQQALQDLVGIASGAQGSHR